MNNLDKLNKIINLYSVKNTAMSIYEFNKILGEYDRSLDSCRSLDPFTKRDILIKGLYCTYFNSYIWVSRTIDPGFIKIDSIYKTDVYTSKFDDIKWSLPISLDWDINKIKRMWQLKVFW